VVSVAYFSTDPKHAQACAGPTHEKFSLKQWLVLDGLPRYARKDILSPSLRI